METIVIGKPAINIYLPLQEYPQEGDLFLITGKNESLGNVGATSACMLAKWKLPVNFTGVVGNDAYAEKVRETFREYKVNTKFLEIDYESGTSINYNTLNVKTGIVTKILYNNPNSQLKKYKYDFDPGFAIIDGTDFAGAHALLNTNHTIKSVFYARIGDKDTIAMAKRCTWVVCTEKFVEMLTHETADGSAESYVALYQKIVDAAGNSNFIVILNSHKILYCVDGKVKMLPDMKLNAADCSSFDSVFTGAFAYCMINNIDVDDAIKFANTAASISMSRIGEVDAIPTMDEVLDNSGLRDKLGMGKYQSPSSSGETNAVEPNESVPQPMEPAVTDTPVQEEIQTQAGEVNEVAPVEVAEPPVEETQAQAGEVNEVAPVNPEENAPVTPTDGSIPEDSAGSFSDFFGGGE